MKLKLKPIWILLLIGAILLFAVFGPRREGFNPTTERPSPSDPSIRATIKSYANLPNDTDPKIGKYITAIQSYYDTKFLPEKTSNSMKVAQFVNEQTDTTIDKQVLTRILDYVFLTVDSTGTSAPPNSSSSTPPASSSSSSSSTPPSSSSSSTPPPSSSSPSSSSSSSTPAAASTSKFSQRIWGPPFAGTGQTGGDGSGDSTKTTVYPQLLGGDTVYGGGKGDQSKIQLPSLGSLGLNANANFFPFSRSPGDMDLIADPYRVSNTFSAASYSPTPAPAPFLTDFSKFQ